MAGVGIMKGYDIWKTTPPEPDEKVAEKCGASSCGEEIMDGQDCKFHSPSGLHFCNRECLDSYLKEDVDLSISEFIDLLCAQGDVYDVTAEAPEPDEPEYEPSED
jgi:hypothetical protein